MEWSRQAHFRNGYSRRGRGFGLLLSYAFVREAVVLMATVTTVMTMSLLLNAPLEELANPAKTPNPPRRPGTFWLAELVSTPHCWAAWWRRH